VYFHLDVDCLHAEVTETVRTNFSSLDSLNVLYVSLALSKLAYASVIWSNLTLPDSNKLETYKENLQIYAIIDLFNPTPYVIVNQC
jgi:hypothetical protein